MIASAAASAARGHSFKGDSKKFFYTGTGGAFKRRPCFFLFSFMEVTDMVKINTFNSRPVWHVRYMPDGSVLLTLYERRPNGRARHRRVSLAQWLAGRGVYLLESHASPRAQARTLARHRCR